MAVIFLVEDQSHRALDRFWDTPGDAFLRLCLRAAQAEGDGWRILRTVGQHSDTLLNPVEQGQFVEELNAVLQRPDLLQDAEPIVRRVLGAVRRVFEEGGYLMIIGE